PPDEKYFTYAELERSGELIMSQAQKAFAVKQRDRTLYQRKIIELANRVATYNRMTRLETPYVVVPLEAGQEWRQIHDAASHAHQGGDLHPSVLAFGRMLQSYGENKPAAFQEALSSYTALINEKLPGVAAKARHETVYQRAEVFYHAS